MNKGLRKWPMIALMAAGSVSLSANAESYKFYQTVPGLVGVDKPAYSCADVLSKAPSSADGNYQILDASDQGVSVYCDMQAGGWAKVDNIQGQIRSDSLYWIPVAIDDMGLKYSQVRFVEAGSSYWDLYYLDGQKMWYRTGVYLGTFSDNRTDTYGPAVSYTGSNERHPTKFLFNSEDSGSPSVKPCVATGNDVDRCYESAVIDVAQPIDTFWIGDWNSDNDVSINYDVYVR